MRIIATVFALFFTLASAAAAKAAPAQSLCGPAAGTGTTAAWPAPDMPPRAQIWHAGDRTKDGPDCTGLQGRNFTLLMTLAGSLRNAAGETGLLAEFGRISGLQGMRYWSASDHRWETLVGQTGALDGANPSRTRADFTPEEMASGKDLYFLQRADRSHGPVLYHMRVLGAKPDQLTVFVENANKINYWFLPLFKPGDIQMLYVLNQAEPGVWHYRTVWGVREAGLAAAGNHDASYVNRAAAMFRHIAGIPTDQEPPLMRDNGKAPAAPPDMAGRLQRVMPSAGASASARNVP